MKNYDFSADAENSYDDEVSLYLMGCVKGGPGWHYCYIEDKGSWKMNQECEHR